MKVLHSIRILLQQRRAVLNLLRKPSVLEHVFNQIGDSDRLRRLEKMKSPLRTEIINYCIAQRNKKDYLEIGVRNPADNFDLIKADNKISVDPGLELESNPVLYQMTSDEFFVHWQANKEIFFDVIFIDGLHRAEQVNRDIEHAIAMTKDDGVVILHDCNPPSEYFAREDFHAPSPAKGSWNGTTYKALWKYAFEGAFDVRIIDSDWGVAVIDKTKTKTPNTYPNPFHEWDMFEYLKSNSSLLISYEEFKDWF